MERLPKPTSLQYFISTRSHPDKRQLPSNHRFRSAIPSPKKTSQTPLSMHRSPLLVAVVTTVLFISSLLVPSHATPRPNVILMMTDDQGIGDFGVSGNELIETPHIDAMATNSGSLTNFYVSPVCSPTRASLMTGRYNQRTRCIDTWLGRSMMDPDEFTLAEALLGAGYRTGFSGKWHLGDCYPMRPQDQGFEEVLVHRVAASPSLPSLSRTKNATPIPFFLTRTVRPSKHKDSAPTSTSMPRFSSSRRPSPEMPRLLSSSIYPPTPLMAPITTSPRT